MIELIDTTSSAIAAEFVRARTRAGSPAMGMVMTLVVVVAEEDAEVAMKTAQEASHEHPARVLGVILGDARGPSQVNAQVGTGAGWTGETALIRLRGEVVNHAVAGPARRGARPAPPQGHQGIGAGGTDQSQRRPAGGLAGTAAAGRC